MQQVRRLGKLQAHSSVLMVCDVQERFRSVITHMPSVLHVARTMVEKSILLAFGCTCEINPDLGGVRPCRSRRRPFFACPCL